MTQEVIRQIMAQRPTQAFGQAFRRAQTFPLALQQLRQQLGTGEQAQRLAELKLQAFPEEQKAARAQQLLTRQQSLATIGLRRAQTLAALTKQRQKATALEKFQQGLQRLQQFGDNDLQGRFLIGSGLSNAGFKIGGLGQFSPTGVAPRDTEALNASMLRPHNSEGTHEEMINEQHQLIPPVQKDLTEQDRKIVNNLDQDAGKSRNIINSILAQPEPKIDEFQKGQLTQLNKDLSEVNTSALHAAEHEKPLYTRLISLVDELPSAPFRGTINWATPKGQEFQALLKRAQGEFIKTFHLGRMTQKEFNIIAQAVGGENLYKSALKNIFNRQLNQIGQDINKAKFYHDYVGKGGRSSEEAALKWLNSIGEKGAPAEKKPTEAAVTIPPLSDERLAQIAQEEGIPLDVLKQRL